MQSASKKSMPPKEKSLPWGLAFFPQNKGPPPRSTENQPNQSTIKKLSESIGEIISNCFFRCESSEMDTISLNFLAFLFGIVANGPKH